MKNLLFKCLAEFIGALIGRRRNLVRLGSFILSGGALWITQTVSPETVNLWFREPF